jgi:hypothetical protein
MSIRRQTELTLHPLIDAASAKLDLSRSALPNRTPFIAQLASNCVFGIALNDDANETCTLRVSLLDGFSDRRLQTLARD